MDIRIDREAGKLILAIADSADDQNLYEYEMLAENEIPEFLFYRKRYVDDGNELVYDISSMISIKELSDRMPLRNVELCMILHSLTECRKAIEEYLLTPEGLILNPEYIFYDVYHKRINYCFYPDYGKDMFLSYREFADYLLLSIDYDDEAAVKLAYDVYAAVLNKDYQLEKYAGVDREELSSLLNRGGRNNEPGPNMEQEIEDRKEQERVTGTIENIEDKVSSNRRTNPISVICGFLLVIIITALITAYIINRRLFMATFANKKYLTVSTLTVGILICIQLMNHRSAGR